MKPKILTQGAEAKIYLESRTDTPTIIKHRLKKSYRHPQLDKQIRKKRTKSEAKILIKAKDAGVNVPKISHIDKINHKLFLEFIDGERLSETLNDKPEKEQFKIMQTLGKQIAKLHKNNIIHGDLTTSNTILAKISNISSAKKGNQKEVVDTKYACGSTPNRARMGGTTTSEDSKIFIIDFGLGFISTKIEDKAVDLHLIKQALEAKHFQNHENLFKNFLKGYEHEETEKILKQLEKVEARGRYKH